MLGIIEAGDEMNLIISTIQQEKQRIDFMLAHYRVELSELPKGTIAEKRTKGETYYYLKYREGKKVLSRYLRQNDVDGVRGRLEKRKHIETMIKSLQEENAVAVKALEGYE